MNKQDALSIVFLVKGKRTDRYVIGALGEIGMYIEHRRVFDYIKTMQFIEDRMPSKMGGVYVDIANALLRLKSQLKDLHNEEKRQNSRDALGDNRGFKFNIK